MGTPFRKEDLYSGKYLWRDPFLADTFFKTFDPERKAEGTEVIFADSIEEIGTITDDMIVLREDPKAYRYQDITDILKEFQAKEQEN